MHRKRGGTKGAVRAFSLLELLLVLIIMGITSAIAAPRYAGFVARSRLSAAVTRIESDLENARQKAKHTGTSQSVAFDSATSSYTLSPSGGPVQQTVMLAEEPYQARIVSVAFGADTTVIFNGYGEPDSTGNVVIQVGSFSQEITLDSSASHWIAVGSITKVN